MGKVYFSPLHCPPTYLLLCKKKLIYFFIENENYRGLFSKPEYVASLSRMILFCFKSIEVNILLDFSHNM